MVVVVVMESGEAGGFVDGGCLQGLSGWLALFGCAFLVCSSGRVRILESCFSGGMIFVLEW